MFWGSRKRKRDDGRDDGEDGNVPSEEEAQPMQRVEDAQRMEDAPAAGDAGAGSTGRAGSEGSEVGRVRERIVAVLKTVYDPEIPVDIYELGLIYGVDVRDDGEVHITMTLTSPMCPVAETLPPEVEDKVRNVLGVKDVKLDLVWDPPWSMDMMSDAARLELNLM